MNIPLQASPAQETTSASIAYTQEWKDLENHVSDIEKTWVLTVFQDSLQYSRQARAGHERDKKCIVPAPGDRRTNHWSKRVIYAEYKHGLKQHEPTLMQRINMLTLLRVTYYKRALI